MNGIKGWTTACLILLSGCLTASCKSAGPASLEPDLVLLGGQVLTGDPSNPMAQALAIGDGRILAIGSDREIERRIGVRTRIVQLGGRTVIAGINDAHDHVGDTPFGIEAVTATPPMADPALAEVVSAVQAAASSVPKGTWVRAVVGPSVMQSAPDALSALEAAVREHPVLLSAWWGHGILVTPAGLSKLQIGEDVSDRPGGEYERDTTGRLTGKLQEYAAWSILERLHSEAGETATVDMLRSYGSKRLAQGVTSVQIMAGYQKPDLFLSALRAASLPVRLRVVAFPLPDAQGNGTDSWANIASDSGDLVTVSGVKWVLDGTPIEQLAYQSAAYPGRPDWYGRPNFSDDHLRAQLQAALDGGEQLLLHVVGDAMAERVLTLMEDMAPPDRWVPLRVRIEHGNGLTGARIARAKRLGIVIAQPRPTSPVREWIDAGIPVAYGSDMGFPPFVAFAQMTDPANPNSVARGDGLAILTQWPAFAEFAEETKGKLAPGMVADMVVLSQDPLTTVQVRLPATVSLLTIVNGDVVHAGDEFAPLLSSK